MAYDTDLPSTGNLVDLDAKVSPIVLAGILGVNVSLLYQEMQVGRLPNPLIDYSYKECIQTYVSHFKKNADLKILKAKQDYGLKVEKLENDKKLREKKLELAPKRTYDSDNGDIPPLMAAKIKQEIRLGIARESHLWIKAAIERGEYISLGVLVDLLEPFIMSIRQALLTIGLESTEAEKQVDLAMETLGTLGAKMIEGAVYDSSRFVQAILAKDIVLEEIEIDNKPARLL